MTQERDHPLKTRLLSVGIRVKIMGLVLATVLVLGVGVILATRQTLRTTLSRELRGNGISLARDLSARLVDFVLTDNLYAVHRILRDTAANNDDILYLVILGPQGVPLADSLTGSPSLPLLTANSVTTETPVRVRRLVTTAGPVQDVAVGLLGGRAGVVRVGMSERALEAEIAAATRRLLAATVFASAVGFLLALGVTAVLVRPVLELVEVTHAVGEGDFTRRAVVHARDEIGQLAADFNRMSANLAASRNELQRSHQRLMRQNRELTAMNAVAASVSQSLDLDRVLVDALQEVLRSVKAKAGQILVADPEAGELVRRAQLGEVSRCREEKATMTLRHGLAGRVFLSGQTLFWPDCHEPPPPDGPSERGRVIGVPLSANGRVVGTMCLDLENETELSAEDLRLLTSFGQQIGVAIENARLCEELRRKEHTRTTLLRQVITAQEDERKRVARELHDQTSQSLTSLLVGLRMVDQLISSPAARAQVQNLRTQLATTLEEVHRLSRELRPSALDNLGLAEALRRLTAEFAQRMELVADYHCVDLDGVRLEAETETTIYRVVQEALTNVAKHAQARNVSVLLERRNDSLVAVVEDDGRGFEETTLTPGDGGSERLGVLGMQERATLVGGRLSLESQPGEGTAVYLEVPLRELMQDA